MGYHGYAHVKGVLSKEECQAWVAGLRAAIESIGYPGRFSDPATWEPSQWPEGCRDGILGEFGVGHCDAAWRARTHRKVVALQEAYWRERQLVTNVDGVNAELPYQELRRRTDAETVKLHWDENPFYTGEHADGIQGVLSLTPTTCFGGGTTVVAGSHRAGVPEKVLEPKDWLRRRTDVKKVFRLLTMTERRKLLEVPGCVEEHLETAAGDVVLFLSRTVHCGRRARDAQHGFRFALYGSTVPASQLEPEDHANKRRVMALEPWPRSKKCRAECTDHPPDGSSIKPRYGYGYKGTHPPTGKSEGIVRPPQWVLDDPALLRFAGALPYDAPTTSPAARLGGKRVAETDGELRKARLARHDSAPPPPPPPLHQVIVEDGVEVIVIE